MPAASPAPCGASVARSAAVRRLQERLTGAHANFAVAEGVRLAFQGGECAVRAGRRLREGAVLAQVPMQAVMSKDALQGAPEQSGRPWAASGPPGALFLGPFWVALGRIGSCSATHVPARGTLSDGHGANLATNLHLAHCQARRTALPWRLSPGRRSRRVPGPSSAEHRSRRRVRQ